MLLRITRYIIDMNYDIVHDLNIYDVLVSLCAVEIMLLMLMIETMLQSVIIVMLLMHMIENIVDTDLHDLYTIIDSADSDHHHCEC